MIFKPCNIYWQISCRWETDALVGLQVYAVGNSAFFLFVDWKSLVCSGDDDSCSHLETRLPSNDLWPSGSSSCWSPCAWYVVRVCPSIMIDCFVWRPSFVGRDTARAQVRWGSWSRVGTRKGYAFATRCVVVNCGHDLEFVSRALCLVSNFAAAELPELAATVTRSTLTQVQLLVLLSGAKTSRSVPNSVYIYSAVEWSMLLEVQI